MPENTRQFLVKLVIVNPEQHGYSDQDGGRIIEALGPNANVTVSDVTKHPSQLIFTFATTPAEISVAKARLIKAIYALRTFIDAANLGLSGKVDFDFKQFAAA